MGTGGSLGITVRWLESFDLFERGYVEALFDRVGRTRNLKPRGDGSEIQILALAGNVEEPSVFALPNLRRFTDVPVLILSDEELRHRFRGYRRRKLVFRNYFQPRWAAPNVYTLPLGLNSELVELTGRVGVEPKLAWAFVGEVKGDRAEMMKSFAGVQPNTFFAASRFDDPDGLRGSKLFETYAASHFVLCPFGNRSPDSFRVMEALQAGAIPVTVQFLGTDHNRLVFGDHPFVVGKNWSHARELVEELLADPEKLRNKRSDVAEWYQDYLSKLEEDLAHLLKNGARSGLISPQFRYQRRAALNPVIQCKYLVHYTKRGRQIRRYVSEAVNRVLVKTRLSRLLPRS